MGAIAKFRTWKVLIRGAIATVKVLSTQEVDLTIQPGTAGPFDFYDNTHAYAPGSVVVVDSNAVIGGITLTPGIYGCRQATNANGTGNQVPQFPLPTVRTNVYWVLIAFSPQQLATCQNGQKLIYINASQPF